MSPCASADQLWAASAAPTRRAGALLSTAARCNTPYLRTSSRMCSSSKHEAYAVLIDGPAGREQSLSHQPSPQAPQQHAPTSTVIGFLVCSGLAIQGSAFVLLRSYLISSMCDSQVLAWSEVMKLIVSIVAVGKRDLSYMRESWTLALVPVAVYGVMNLLSFWSMKKLPASLSIVIIQQKLVFTAICSRIFLARPLLTPRSFALAAIVRCRHDDHAFALCLARSLAFARAQRHSLTLSRPHQRVHHRHCALAGLRLHLPHRLSKGGRRRPRLRSAAPRNQGGRRRNQRERAHAYQQ